MIGRCSHQVVVVDSDTSEVFCKKCMEVLPRMGLSAIQPSPGHSGGLSPLNSYSIGLTTVINPDSKDYSGKKIKGATITPLVDSSRKAKTSLAVNKNKFRGVLELQRMCQVLDLPKGLENVAKETFNDFCQKGYLKGKNLYSSIYCILLITCANCDIPLSINQVLKYTSVTRKRINMDYHGIYRLYEEAPRTMAGVRAHTEKIVALVRQHPWSLCEEYAERMNEIQQKLQKSGMIGRRALITLVAVTVEYLKKWKYPAVYTFLKNTGLNKNTVMGRIEEMKKKEENLFL